MWPHSFAVSETRARRRHRDNGAWTSMTGKDADCRKPQLCLFRLALSEDRDKQIGRHPGTRKVVGATGFEPATPCAQGRCATRLRYAPTPLDCTVFNPSRETESRKPGPALLRLTPAASPPAAPSTAR